MENQRRYDMFFHAFRTVPYYQELARKHPEYVTYAKQKRNWHMLPAIQKNQIAFQQDRMISSDYLGKLVTGQLLRGHTSGSTGTYLDVYWDKADQMASLMPLWVERYKFANIHTRDRVCMFNTVLPNNMEYQIVENKMTISKRNLSLESLCCLYSKIAEFSPKWILLHPGIATMLLYAVRKNQLPELSELQYIELTGEMILEGLEKSLEQTFNCKVRGHYGTMEVNSIGVEIEEKGGYRVFDKTTFLEVLDDNANPVREGEIGEIYVTSLCNRAMPTLRYGIGDMGYIQNRKDGKQVVWLKQARKNDLLVLPNGEKIPPDVLLGPVEQINRVNDQIVYQFQVVQENQNTLVIKTVLDQEMETEEFIRVYHKLLDEKWKNDFKLEFCFNDKIVVNANTGKNGWFTNKIRIKKKENRL